MPARSMVVLWASFRFSNDHSLSRQHPKGENVGIRSRDRSGYQIAILEVAGSSDGVEDMLSMEDLWEGKLQSRGIGLDWS